MPGLQMMTILLAAAFLASGCSTLSERSLPRETVLLETAPQGEISENASEPDPEADLIEATHPQAASSAAVPPSIPADLPEGEILRGWEIFDDTPGSLGAAAAQRGELYQGNALSCRNCHLDHGTRPGAFPLTEFSDTRRYAPRVGLAIGGAERVNACLQRALGASPLPIDSLEIASLLAYLRWIGEEIPTVKTEKSPLDLPERAADPASGEVVFHADCASCHDAGDNAPALWGDQSYGAGSDMHRLLIATAFIQNNMPPHEAALREALTLSEAYDVAAFINSLERPVPEGLEQDYPALTEKPHDSSYPPYPDSFSQQQHQYGPFGPIEEERERQRRADRWTYWAVPPPADVSGTVSASERE